MTGLGSVESRDGGSEAAEPQGDGIGAEFTVGKLGCFTAVNAVEKAERADFINPPDG